MTAQVSLAFATRFYDFLTEVDALKAELAVFSARKAQCFCCSNRHLNLGRVVSQKWGSISGIPIMNKDYSILGSMLGSLCFGRWFLPFVKS